MPKLWQGLKKQGPKIVYTGLFSMALILGSFNKAFAEIIESLDDSNQSSQVINNWTGGAGDKGSFFQQSFTVSESGVLNYITLKGNWGTTPEVFWYIYVANSGFSSTCVTNYYPNETIKGYQPNMTGEYTFDFTDGNVYYGGNACNLSPGSYEMIVAQYVSGNHGPESGTYVAGSIADTYAGGSNFSFGLADIYFKVYTDDDEPPPPPSDDTNTRVEWVSPTGTTTATTTIEANWYLNSEDWEESSQLKIVLDKNTCPGFAGVATSNCSRTYEQDISLILTDLELTFSTTTTLAEGAWRYRGSIQSPTYCFLGYCLFENEAYTTSGSFIVGSSTLDDIIASSTIDAINQGSNATSTVVYDITTCSVLSGLFDVTNCMKALFVPDPRLMVDLVKDARDSFLTSVPIGYVTRTVSILNSTTTIDLPELSFIFPQSFPIPFLASTTWGFDPWEYGYKDGSPIKDLIVSPTDGKNVWEIAEPWYEGIFLLALILLIVKDLTKIHQGNNKHDSL